ncbi:hypothetical protein SAMN05216565_107113 [Litchfieldia salsa]|uniref:Uncharacterized protein n=1 Tax=Litchfieldia salsa TaxID=930152 RepID=A0A1H0VP12_9BACI|nr:hypothetical protein SAMN05216565_107113 [Litchfieldia salsa]
MEIGGLVLDALKIVFGNVDVMFIILSFSIGLALALTTLAIYQYMKE